MTTALDRCMSATAAAPLTREQKRDVAMLARRAWLRAGRPYYDQAELDTGCPWAMTPTEALTLYRQEETVAACGRRSLRACTQADYPAIMARMSDAAGLPQLADYWRRRAMGDGTRRAKAVLAREMAAAREVIADPAGYVARIAACKFKADVERLNEKQIWTILFDLRRAAAARRKKGVHTP